MILDGRQEDFFGAFGVTELSEEILQVIWTCLNPKPILRQPLSSILKTSFMINAVDDTDYATNEELNFLLTQ